MLDLITTPADKVDLSRYTLENYFDISTYKTAYYSFYLPVACGLVIAGIEDASVFKVAEEILIPMGQYFQVQDDYLDCYADPELLGKIGTDIQDNKCSWLICQALNRATPDQRELLMVQIRTRRGVRICGLGELWGQGGKVHSKGQGVVQGDVSRGGLSGL